MRGRARRLAGPAAMAAAMFAILVGLGVWQLHRLAWKEGILGQIAAAEAGPAVKLPADPSPFAKVVATGRWGGESARYSVDVRSTAQGDRMGSYVITPLLRDGAPPVLVDRGWLPDGAAVPTPAGEVRVVGYVRRPEHAGWLSPPDDVGQRRFYTLDPGKIGAALGVQPAPFTLVAMGPADQVPWPAQTLPRPPNNHLNYALTWFGLAGALVLVFGFFVREVSRSNG